mgnify:CR=1 FL=1
MNTTARIFWLLALIIFTCGCSTIRTVSLPGDDPMPGGHEGTDRVAGVGDTATFELRDGSRVTGTILEITEVGVLLRNGEPPVGNEIEVAPVEPTPPTTVSREEIVSITKKVTDTGKSVLAVALVGASIYALATADYVSGPYEFIALPDAGHWLPERAVDEVAAALLDHLSRFGGNPSVE